MTKERLKTAHTINKDIKNVFFKVMLNDLTQLCGSDILLDERNVTRNSV